MCGISQEKLPSKNGVATLRKHVFSIHETQFVIELRMSSLLRVLSLLIFELYYT